jgi:alkaline phosphatase
MHVLDYERALGELLELDNTIKETVAHLKKLGSLNETLILVTADHGHGLYHRCIFMPYFLTNEQVSMSWEVWTLSTSRPKTANARSETLSVFTRTLV